MSGSTDSAHCNPYAICHSIVTTFRRTLRWACVHVPYYYVALLEAEQQSPAGSTHRIRFEDAATQPVPVLTNLLDKVFGLPSTALPRLGT